MSESQPRHAPPAALPTLGVGSAWRLPLAEMWLIVVLLVFVAFGAYQLQLPGFGNRKQA